MDWLLILAVCTALYALVRLGFYAADAVTDSLARAVTRRQPVPTHSITRKECAWCGRFLSEVREPYDPEIGALSVSHGICGVCLDIYYPQREPKPRPVVIDLDASREEVAERCAVLRGEVA